MATATAEQTNGKVAKASVTTSAPREQIWEALLDPVAIRQYMFGTSVLTDWQVGHPIVWKGLWKGKPYEDKGVVLKVEPERRLQYTHYSPLSGTPDAPESYHTVTIELVPQGDQTVIALAQDNNPTDEARAQSEKNWAMMLEDLKKYVEG
jgi:uncharacterized protein YndB with AHSA1/START domain